MRRSLGAIAAALALGLTFTPGASAFVEVGNPCVANDTEAGATMIGFSNQGSEPFMQSETPPEGRYVITRWRVQVGPGLGPIQQQLVLSHHVAEEESVRTGESAVETLVAGNNEFATRIPVGEYENVGLRGPEQTLICNQPMNSAGRVKGAWTPGEVRHFEVQVHVGAPVIVRVERDADGDGYGDESQDGCPMSIWIQAPCPTLSLTARHEVKEKAVLVHVTSTANALTGVSGQVSWKVRRPNGGKRRLVADLGIESRYVTGGTTATFRVPLTNSVKRRLEQLTPKQSLRAKLTVEAIDPLKTMVRRELVVRLRGRGGA